MAAEEVEGIDGLLIAIFIWLPPILIFKFRCVSKRWKNIIDDRFFRESYHAKLRNRQLYYRGGRILAFIQETYCSRISPCSGIHPHVNILPVAQMDDLHIMQIPKKFGDVISCSNGVILCNVKGRKSFHVVNPLTRRWVKVPPYTLWSTARFGFSCEEHAHESITSFRIVGVELERITMRIETYASETGKWTTSTVVGADLLNVNVLEGPYVFNCAFHYHRDYHTLAVYDPREDENHFQVIELPQDEFKFTLTRSYDDDVLWVGTNDQKNMKFWKLPKDEHGSYKRTTAIARDEWILMYTVDTQSLCEGMPLFLEDKKRKKHNDGKVDDKFYVSFEAFTPWNPMSVVLSHNQRVFRYNLESQTTELIPYHGVPLADGLYMRPYFEPLSLSTYAQAGKTYG